jgi:transcriptional regulator with XRE-family HTH domain
MAGPPDDYTLEMAREALAARMATVRKELDLSQHQAAERGGLDASNWSKMERGKVPKPQLDTLLKVQYALKLDSLDALFGPQPTRELLRLEQP